MDGLQFLDDVSQSLSADADFALLPDAVLPAAAVAPCAAVPIATLPPRYPPSELLRTVLTRFFPEDDPRQKPLVDALANKGFTTCADLAELAKFWRKEIQEIHLSDADRYLHWLLMQVLCDGSQTHKNYDRIGKFIMATARAHPASGQPAGELRRTPSFEETSRQLRLCLDKKAKDPFYNVVRDKYFVGGGQLITRRELVSAVGGVYCCFCAHKTAYIWDMESKREFKRLFEHLEKHKDAHAEKRPAPSDAALPPAQRQRTIEDVMAARSSSSVPLPPPDQQRL